MSHTEFHLVLQDWMSLCLGSCICCCLASSALQATVLWLKWRTSLPAADITLYTNSLNASLITSCSVCAKHATDTQSTLSGMLAATMLLTLSWTHATTFPVIPQASTDSFSAAARLSAVCLPGMLFVRSTADLTCQSSSVQWQVTVT